MALFKFNGVPLNRELHEACGLTEDLALAIIQAISECMNETLKESIIKERNYLTGKITSVDAYVSSYELAQAGAEIVEELTPEISYFIGICVTYEIQNKERHIKYITNMLND